MTRTCPEDLAGEAERYLAAVTVFRSEGCEPHWHPEPGSRRRRRRRSEDPRDLLALSKRTT